MRRRYAATLTGTALLLLGAFTMGARHGAAVDKANNNPSVRDAATLQQAFESVAKNVEPAVVNVQVEVASHPAMFQHGPNSFNMPDFPFDQFFHFFQHNSYQVPGRLEDGAITGQGSGFIFRRDGYILTNHHVVDGAKTVKVQLSDGTELPAKIVGTDSRLDLAVLKIDAGHDLSTVDFGNSDAISVGQWAIAIGNPFGLDQTLTVGVISAKGRELDQLAGKPTAQEFIQTDAAINPGNSGGPLLDIYGNVIGINNAIYSTSGGNVGIGFAIPINNAKSVLDELINTGHVTRGYLGVMIQELTPDIATGLGLQPHSGVLVSEVEPNTPAAAAGLQAGDVITAYKGEKVEKSRDLQRLVAGTKVGVEADVEFLRDGKTQHTTIKIGELPNDGDQEPNAVTGELGWRGAVTTDLTPDMAQKLGIDKTTGVLVTRVQPDSPAADAGLSRGTVILRVGSTPVTNHSDFKRAVRKAAKDKPVTLYVWDHGHRHFVAVAPPSAK